MASIVTWGLSRDRTVTITLFLYGSEVEVEVRRTVRTVLRPNDTKIRGRQFMTVIVNNECKGMTHFL